MRIVPSQPADPAEGSRHNDASGPAEERQPVPGWIDEELLARTRRVWAEDRGQILTDAEAVEILENLRRLAEVLLKARAGAGSEGT